MTIDIAAIKARADKAAAGPWAVYMDDYTVRVDQSFIPDQIKVALCATGNNVVNNASFIAHARADIPALIAALEAAERERDALKAAAKDLAEYASYAEIVGGISVNKPQIRRECDAVFECIRKIEDPSRRACAKVSWASPEIYDAVIEAGKL